MLSLTRQNSDLIETSAFMIRLAVPGIDERTRREIGRRLHHAQVQADLLNADIAAMLVPADSSGSDPRGYSAAEPQDLSISTASIPMLFVPSALANDGEWQSCVDAATNGNLIRIANPLRFAPAVVAVRSQVKAGVLGLPGMCRLHHWHSPISQIESKQVGHQRPVSLNWPSTWLCEMDVVMWLMQGAPERVFALQQTVDASPTSTNSAFGTIQLHCTWSAGGMALLDFCDQLPIGEGYRSMMLIGSSGAAYLDDQQDRQLVFRGGAPQTILDQQDILPLTAMLQDFVNRCIDAATSGVSRSDAFSDQQSAGSWADVLKLVELAQRSLKTGLAVEWKDASNAG